MVKKLDERDSAQSTPRALQAKTSALLSGMLRCGICRNSDGEQVRMHRGTTQGRPGYSCPICHQTITKVEDYIVNEFHRVKGERLRWSIVEEVHDGGAALLPEIEHRLSELGAQLQATDDDGEADHITAQMTSLRQLRRDTRTKDPVSEWRAVRGEQTFAEDWADAESPEDRRAVLDDALTSIEVVRGRVGRGLDTSRLIFHWKNPEDVGSVVVPDDETLAAWAEA